MAAQAANSANQIAALKELYTNDSEFMKDLVYKMNPFLALIPKDESEDGMAGKYLPVPLEYATPQGRSHSFANAQNQQTPASLISFFVTIVSDYQVVSITNLLMEQTKSSAGAFIDSAKQAVDGGIRNITNNIAFELFGDGTGTRGASTAASSQTGGTAQGGVSITLASASQVVQFEVGMLLVASATPGGAPSTDTVIVTSVDRAAGVIKGTASAATLSANWAIGTGTAYLSIAGDIPSTGITSISQATALAGLGAWIPATAPAANDNFWGVNRSADPTRLAGLRYDASAYTIEEGMTNALALLNREGGNPDLCIMSFASFNALINALGAKVSYVQAAHGEVDVAFEGVRFQTAYGSVTVLADRSCPAQTCYLLTRSTWKMRSLGKVPKILTYGMEGLDGLRQANADALEIRIGYYGQLVCSAPGFNMVVKLSA